MNKHSSNVVAFIWLSLVQLSSMAAFVWLIIKGHPYAAVIPAIFLLSVSFKNDDEEVE